MYLNSSSHSGLSQDNFSGHICSNKSRFTWELKKHHILWEISQQLWYMLRHLTGKTFQVIESIVQWLWVLLLT
jgi:hypothetical protein